MTDKPERTPTEAEHRAFIKGMEEGKRQERESILQDLNSEYAFEMLKYVQEEPDSIGTVIRRGGDVHGPLVDLRRPYGIAIGILAKELGLTEEDE